MSIWVSLRGMLMLIRVDTLRRVHNVCFLAGRLNFDVCTAIIENLTKEFGQFPVDNALKDMIKGSNDCRGFPYGGGTPTELTFQL